MFKKFLSLVLALMMIMSVAVVAASAAQVEVADEAAEGDVVSQGAEEDVASQGADEEVAATGSSLDPSKCVNFDASTTGWNNFGSIGFYFYEIDGEGELIPWGGKKLFKSEETSAGIWSYDPEANGITFDSSKHYFVIFINENAGSQTCNLIFDTSCIGDTAYCTGNELENDVDSNKKNLEVKWRNSSLGPMKVVTSIGNVVGDTIPGNTNAYDMFVSFLKEKLDNARTYSGKNDQNLLDDTAKALGIGKDDVEKAITESGKTGIDWSKDKSTLEGSSSSDSSSSSSNTSNSSNSSSNSSNSSSSSTTKSGSASNTQTGQETTVLFIMLGVMVAAAGVIFFARKREQA